MKNAFAVYRREEKTRCVTSFFVLQIFFQKVNLIKFLPGKVKLVSAEMTICGCLGIDRSSEVECLYNCRRAKVKVFINYFAESVVA